MYVCMYVCMCVYVCGSGGGGGGDDDSGAGISAGIEHWRLGMREGPEGSKSECVGVCRCL